MLRVAQQPEAPASAASSSGVQPLRRMPGFFFFLILGEIVGVCVCVDKTKTKPK